MEVVKFLSLSLSLSWLANETLFIRVPWLGLHKTPLLVDEEVLLRGPFLHDKIRRVTTDRPQRAHSEDRLQVSGLLGQTLVGNKPPSSPPPSMS